MCCSNDWNQPDMTLEQLPTLQELLRCCDDKLLVRTIVEDHQKEEEAAASSKRRKVVKRRLARSLAVMRALSVERPSCTAVLLPEEVFVVRGNSGLIERRIVASLEYLDDEEIARQALMGEAEPLAFQPHAYARVPWETSLAFRVYLAGPWCLSERYQMLASAFWELTFFGFEYDQALARQAEVKAELLMGSVSDRTLQQNVHRTCDYGLEPPDHFVENRREALARRVGILNDAARRDFFRRFLDLTTQAQAA